MSDDAEYRCFVGGLSWSTTDRVLKDEFEKFGSLVDAKVTYLCRFFFMYLAINTNLTKFHEHAIFDNNFISLFTCYQLFGFFSFANRFEYPSPVLQLLLLCHICNLFSSMDTGYFDIHYVKEMQYSTREQAF